MKIGIIDSDGLFVNSFFKDKNIKIVRKNPGYSVKNKEFHFSHAEYVCALILIENPEAELVLYNIIGGKKEKQGILLYESIAELIDVEKVDIINISVGVEISFSEELYNLCKRSPIPIVAAHSNNGHTAYPASYENVIGVKRCIEGMSVIKKGIDNDVLINNKMYVSVKQLGQEHLMEGNSWYAAKMTGIISRFMPEVEMTKILDIMQKSKLNKRCSIVPDKLQKTILITNRIEDEMQVAFIKDCFGNVDVLELQSIKTVKLDKRYGLLFIDIDKYEDFNRAKNDLFEFMISNSSKIHRSYIRYPFFSFYDRFILWTKNRILIEQMYL